MIVARCVFKNQKTNTMETKATTDVKVISSGAGTKKRKELHGSVSVRSLSGTLGDKLDGATFYAYKMDFSCNISEEKFSSFVLLLETKLDGDVGNIEVELYLIAEFVRSSVSFSGLTNLDAKQMAKARCFQELMVNGLFGELFVKSSSGQKSFVLDTEESLWDLSNSYLLLPLESVEEGGQECVRINWTGIDSCVSAVEFLKQNAWLSSKQPESIDKNSSAHLEDSVVTKLDGNVIHLANRSVSVENLKGMVVVAIHTGKIYSILDAPSDTSGYYKKKWHRILLKYPEQPLLLLKQSHNPRNLLVNKGSGKKSSQPERIPPELLIGTDLRTDAMKSFYLLPSLMHRMESLMLASQLRQEIAHHTGELNIPSSVILEALTTVRCAERFSLQRLETLGDAVLKYAVSCHLFLEYPKKEEGPLTDHRSTIVGNPALHKFGVDRKLQGYIRDCAFDPCKWTAPGQRSVWPSPCNHCVDTREVPMDDKFFTEDVKIKVGNTCSKGHRWMISKDISDCVEALIGAYYVGGGLTATLSLMKWLGIVTELEPSSVHDAIKAASLHSYAPHIEAINILESKIGYKFNFKGLLLVAITHASEAAGISGRLCTGHTYHEALGDLFESIVGAILIDSKLDLDEVWKVVEPLLSPIVTPEELELAPFRELKELCDSLGFLNKDYTKKGDSMHAEFTLQLEDVLLNGQGSGPNKTAAKGMAAHCLLEKLEAKGISSSYRKNHKPDQGSSDGNIRSSTFKQRF
ncbi:endoribonuclease Dicer homolog 3-like isoform X3 [Henckelia pumila]|uniref:endoribonuclease Dicer homolog 3-like isoform X3 n=1 Tax=Henckelia pumila TaxID=405737 RepID=UPI003C6E1B7E